VACADEVERLILEAGPENVAAVIAEPIVGSTGGAIDPPDDYWPRLAAICRTHGVLLIADEVMTGFGRTGRRFGVDHFDVVPDILVSGKGLAGGYAPIAGVFARHSVVAPMAESGEDLMFYTFGAHPGPCAAASAVLDILVREKLVERAAEMGARLRKRLAALADHPHVAQIRGRGLMIGIELVRDRDSLERFDPAQNITGRVVANGLREGVFFYPAGAGESRDAVMLGPPFIIGDAEVEKIVDALQIAIDRAVA
jgi:adenosylmethionine-8-amino-7-oxononanoate aminotransferase